jgi:hypothetical protein
MRGAETNYLVWINRMQNKLNEMKAVAISQGKCTGVFSRSIHQTKISAGRCSTNM